jgi:hypothetical protein
VAEIGKHESDPERLQVCLIGSSATSLSEAYRRPEYGCEEAGGNQTGDDYSGVAINNEGAGLVGAASCEADHPAASWLVDVPV